jgi:hypothetical protein
MARREQSEIRRASEKLSFDLTKAKLVFEDHNVIHVDFTKKKEEPSGWKTLENVR